MQQPLVFASLAAPGATERAAFMLVESIRAFGGAYSNSPVLILYPRVGPGLSHATQARFTDLGAETISFDIPLERLTFPFASKVYGAGAAEEAAISRGALLCWMDPDSLVLREPGALILEPAAALGYRPVDKVLIGSPYEAPLDDFWMQIYSECGVHEHSVFPMAASVDDVVLRPYFNAGMLVVRPERGLLGSWGVQFKRLHGLAKFEPFYQAQELYRLFMHQAVLAGTILASLGRHEIQELPYTVNYPLHLHPDYPATRRPHTISEIITCRYDTAFDADDWRSLPIEEPLRAWLEARIARRRI